MDDVQYCRICKKRFVGEVSRLEAEACEVSHNRIFLYVWDFELPKLVSFFNTFERELLPEEFLKQVKKLHGRALRGK